MRVVVLLAILLGGCSSIELDEQNPGDHGLDGEWVLATELSDATPNLQHGLGAKRRRSANSQREMQVDEILGAAGSGLAFIVHDFQVLSAERMTVELNHDSMGVRYQPGIYRDVSWGERRRGLWQVYAGWEDRDLVIISEAKDLYVVERTTLERGNLVVRVTVKADRGERLFTRVFRRPRS